jgi:hypothetical protein
MGFIALLEYIRHLQKSSDMYVQFDSTQGI